MFSAGILKPSSTDYVTVGQRILNASGARYVLFWMSQLLGMLLASDPQNPFLQKSD